MPSLSVTNSLTPSRQRTPTKVSTPSKTFTRITASLEASPTYHHETIFHTPSNSSSREISRSFTVSPSVGTASHSRSRVDNSRSPTSTASGGSWTRQLSVTESRTVSMPSTKTPSPTKDALTTTVTNWNPTHSQSQSFSQERPSKSLSVGGTMTAMVITNTTTFTHRRQTRGATDPLSPSKTVSRAGGRGGADEEAAAAFSETKTLALTNELSLSSTRSIDLVPWPVMSSTQSVTAASLIAAFTAIFSGTHVGTFGAASTLAAVTMISCNEEHLYSATGLSRLVLSIWYDVGSVASVWGNIGIVVIVTVLHRFAVSIALRRLRPLQQQKKQQLQPRAKGRGKDAIASSNNDDDDILQQAMANVRFPSISIAVMLFLMPGTTYAAASCFADTSNTAYVVTGALGLIICAGATVFSIRLFLAATAQPTISSTGGPLAADDNDDDAIFGEDLDDVAKVTPLARAAGSTITSHNTAVVLARQHHIAQLRFSVFAAQPHRQPSAAATGNLQHDHSVVVAAVSSSSVHQPQPPTSDLPFFVFLKTHSTLLCLVAGLPFRRSSGTTPSSSYSTTSSCTAQYAIMAAWVFMPVVVLLMYRCCRGAFLPLPARPTVLNMLVILISLVTTGLMVAVAIFFHKDFDRRSSSDDAISAVGWVLVALLAVQAVCTIVLPLFQSASSFVAAHRREQDEEGKGGEGGDTLVMEDHFNDHRSDDGDGGAVMRSLYQEDGDELSKIGNATHVAKDDYRSRTGNNDQHRGTRSSSNNYYNNSNKGNWLHTMPTPKEFLLGVPESAFQPGGSEGEIGGGGLRVNAWQRAMWYDSVPLATKLEVARLDALICSALVEREDAARRSLQQAETIRTNHSTNSMGIEEEYDASTLPESAVEFAIVTAMANAEQNKSRKNRGAFETMRKQNVRVALEAMVQRITLVSSIAVTVVAPTSLL
ncbi:GPI-anchored surface protein, putative [Bodo saltans]|uniref:GPI-anchored surface protein, putative n=1 Tax=Bodo saltans TaxID=75058 RepID=A0A0S4JFB5_BODSA|nr:GPI-anchored surface protein, putative [Bodo saltans]|eukprot:CUG88116.1 GPI-anchored surface protein, putative [Bodo saltans]